MKKHMNYTTLIKSLRPSAKEMEHVSDITQQLSNHLETITAEKNFNITITPGGSTAKGTNLQGNFDVDIFIQFKTEGKLDDMLETLLEGMKYDRVHGSRDYFTLEYGGFFVELVPVKHVTSCEEAENVTDMSPLHVQWAQEHLTDKLRDDIRLAKQFCKATGVYGAESYINGISGHVLDILLIYYGGFDAFIDAVCAWNGLTVIDPENQHEDPLHALNQAKLTSPLIVIDPIDKNRNAAAAMNTKTYEQLISAAKSFKASPDKTYFEIDILDENELCEEKKDTDELFVIEATPLKGKRDVTFTKLLKIKEFIERHLELAEFTVRKAGWQPQENKAVLFFFVDSTPLKKEFVRQGPPASQLKDVAKFKEVNPRAFEQNGKWCVIQTRKYIHAHDYVQKLVDEQYVQSRVANILLKQH